MLKITAEEIHFIIYQYLHESGFEHSSFVFAQEANMHENRFNEYRIPSGMLIVFLEKALTLIHMETHLDDNEEIKECRQPYTLLTPHTCDISVEQTSRTVQDQERQNLIMDEDQPKQYQGALAQDVDMKNTQFSRIQQQQQQQYDGRYQQALPHQMLNDNYHQQQIYQAHMLSQVYGQNAQGQIMDMANFQKYPNQQHPYMQQQSMYMQQQSMQNSKAIQAEVLEHSPEKGVYFLQAEGENLEISSAQFNPKQRLLVTGGNYYSATMWDLCREPNLKFGELQGHLPHVKHHSDTDVELQADVSSVHWSYDGSRLVTSSNDMMARIWRFDEETGHINIESVKTFNMMLMNSKFNKPPQDGKAAYTQLVATGGHSGVVTVWNANSEVTNKDVAKLVHTQLDPNLVGIEIDWQNGKTVAITGYSKSIYLWNIQAPQGPVQVWTGGHADEIEQIKWDPTGRLLASCSTDNRVCLWKCEQSSPAHIFEDFTDRVNQIQWSNASSFGSILLAAGSLDGSIAVWNVNERELCFKFLAHPSEPAGVKSLAFSPNNRMLATGGQDTLCVWSLQEKSSDDSLKGVAHLLKQYQKPQQFTNTGKVSGSGATATATQQNKMEGGEVPETEFSQVGWSHDGLLLAAAIHNRISIFDVRKFNLVTGGVPARQSPVAPVQK